MAGNGTSAWIETVLWIRNVFPLELLWRSACIPLVPCTVIILVNELVKLIGG
ncbi:MAG: hypothetical protein LKJ90_07605 [Faecalibacterium sp.]|jgi:hypothetical protein|nr:hypothetical protein [Faecalibacterium sp.]